MIKRAAAVLAAAFAAAIGLAVLTGQAPARAESAVTLGAGAVTGVYYPVGEAIKMLVDRDTAASGVRITVESTAGSVENLTALRRGALDLAFMQSDVAYQAFNGLAPFAEPGPFRELRVLFSGHAEAFTIVARGDAGIASLADLAGKRVNVGNPESGTRILMDLLMAAQGWTLASFAGISEYGPEEAAQALCNRRFDAMAFAVGHPNGTVLQAVAGCRGVIVPVTGPAIDRLLAAHPYLVRTAVPGGMYASSPGDIPTFGVRAVLATTSRLPDDAAYTIVKSVFENLDLFRWLHPALTTLDRTQMIREGLLVPLHTGAARYYREAGLMN